MTTTTTAKANGVATAPVKHGFGSLPCPRCGEDGGIICIDLNDLTAGEACPCRECEAFFGLDDVRHIIAKWAPVLAWIDTAPIIVEE